MPDLVGYLELEDDPVGMADLEAYLKERGMIGQKPGLEIRDVKRLSFELFLNFKLNRYRDIIDAGNALQRSYVVIPESMKEDYVKVLGAIGDSFQKLDYLYESVEYYRRALELEPGNLGILLSLRKSYERLNDEEKVGEVNGEARKMLLPAELVFSDGTVAKGVLFSRAVYMEGKKEEFRIFFEPPQEGTVPPLISIFFNGTVVWEEYLKGEALTFSLETRPGLNTLQLVPVNSPVKILKITHLAPP
jgi:tetratricopeptide (TPR) repeat protein